MPVVAESRAICLPTTTFWPLTVFLKEERKRDFALRKGKFSTNWSVVGAILSSGLWFECLNWNIQVFLFFLSIPPSIDNLSSDILYYISENSGILLKYIWECHFHLEKTRERMLCKTRQRSITLWSILSVTVLSLSHSPAPRILIHLRN